MSKTPEQARRHPLEQLMDDPSFDNSYNTYLGTVHPLRHLENDPVFNNRYDEYTHHINRRKHRLLKGIAHFLKDAATVFSPVPKEFIEGIQRGENILYRTPVEDVDEFGNTTTLYQAEEPTLLYSKITATFNGEINNAYFTMNGLDMDGKFSKFSPMANLSYTKHPDNLDSMTKEERETYQLAFGLSSENPLFIATYNGKGNITGIKIKVRKTSPHETHGGTAVLENDSEDAYCEISFNRNNGSKKSQLPFGNVYDSVEHDFEVAISKPNNNLFNVSLEPSPNTFHVPDFQTTLPQSINTRIAKIHLLGNEKRSWTFMKSYVPFFFKSHAHHTRLSTIGR